MGGMSDAVAAQRATPRRCVYTALFGGYEQLNEQPEAAKSGVPFLCLTDDPQLQSETWRIVLVTPEFGMDPIRSQREVKIRAHRYLPDFDQSLYIDNTVLLIQPPERVFETYQDASGLTVFPHSFRDTTLDEFLVVAREGLDDSARIFEQLNHYFAERPDVLQEKPYWTGILLRSHAAPAVVKAMETWALHVLRYARRDQLSLNFALRPSGLTPHSPEVDNHASWFHSWPHPTLRRADMRRANGFSLSPPIAQLRSLEQRLAEESAAHRGALEDRDRQRQTDRAAFEEREAEIRAELDQQREEARRCVLHARIESVVRGLVDPPSTWIGWRKALSRTLRGQMKPILDVEAAQRANDRLAIAASGLFDAAWYVARNPDTAELDPLDHYLDHGGAEGRAPGPNFDGRWYLEAYPDVARPGANPLVHFLRFGFCEGRRRGPGDVG
jgi:Protein of unknown function (DUF616)